MANYVESKNFSLALANKILAEAQAKAEEIGKAFCLAIVDQGGNLKAFNSMDGASLLSKGIAEDKAYTAVSFNRPTHEWYDAIKDEKPLLHGLVHTPRFIIFGGGYPIQLNGETIGGIGVSGGSAAEDMQVAEAGLAVLEGLE